MNSTYLLERCEQIANFSALMLAAAQKGNWQEVDQLKVRAGIVINEMRALSITVALSADERRVKLATMQRILANDARIRELAQPWLVRMAQWLPNVGTRAGHCSGILR
jgi:flagellar protein FliT